MRPDPLVKLLQSVQKQTLYPNEVIVIDGSQNEETRIALQQNLFNNLHYYKVSDQQRGLTKQRNIGIAKAGKQSEIICFLDDDIVLEPDYFEKLIGTYSDFPAALGVGGYIVNETVWEKVSPESPVKSSEFQYDGWKRKDSSRYIIRNFFGLDSDCTPAFSPTFSHGRSVSFLPPTGKTYDAEQLMGGVSSFKRAVFDEFSFSAYFQGYGLYEDADFTIRVAKKGKLYVNTAAKVFHYHNESGRPNQYNYGKMVVRNGWYVWRIKNPKPSFADKIKWHAITLLLIVIRYCNIFTASGKKAVFTEALGRTSAWVRLWVDKPRLQ
jgi:GT2 family glycosyltransferase